MRLLFFILLLANAAIVSYFMLVPGQAELSVRAHSPIKPEAIRIYRGVQLSDKKTSIAANGVCVEWSGIPEQSQDKARQALVELGLKDHIVLQTMSDFWVHIPPQKNQQDAERKLGELKSLDVDDGVIVQDDGKWRFAISLAAFASRNEADFHLKQLRDKGIRSAKVVERHPSTATLTLLGLDSEQVGQLDKLKGEFEKSEMRNVECRVQ